MPETSPTTADIIWGLLAELPPDQIYAASLGYRAGLLDGHRAAEDAATYVTRLNESSPR